MKLFISPFHNWPLFFLVFLGVGFVAPSLPFWALFFYIGFIPAFGFHLYRHPDAFDFKGWTFESICLFLGFTWLAFISCFYAIFGDIGWKWVIDFCCTSLFLWGGAEAARRDPAFLEKVGGMIAIGGAVNGFLALIARFFFGNIDHYAPDRMAGWGVFRPIVFAGDLAGLSVIILISMLIACFDKQKGFCRSDYIFLLLLAFEILFLFLTKTRIACIGGLIYLFTVLLQRKRLWLIPAGCLCIAAGFAGAAHGLFDRLDSGHVIIWQKTILQICTHFWTGTGMTLKMQVPDGNGGFFPHPHSFYLSLFRQIGLMGCILFLLAFAGLLFSRFRTKEGRKIIPFVTYALLCGATDLSFVFKGPSEEWVLIWLPFLMLMAASGQQRKDEKAVRNRDG